MKLDYSDQYAFYAYDADGRMYSDSGRGIRGIDYSWANKPRRIDMSTTSGIFQQDNTSMYCNHYADGVRESNDLVIMNEFTQTSQYTYYADSFVFDGRGQNGKPGLFSRLLLPWGYVDRGRKVYTYIHDYQGNIRAVVDSAGVAVQTTDYYPYGAPMATSTGASVNPYKYSGKEYETRKSLNQYDFHARNQLPILGLFDQPDTKAGDYPWLNPYLYCAANPIAYIDPTGEDIFVLNKGNDGMHLAMLIQNENGVWQYYSINGNNVYSPISKEHSGGRPFNDISIGAWNSPEEFLNSDYNKSNGKEGKEDTSINNYNYKEGYLISTTSEQDALMRSEFTRIADTEYDIVFNNCATAVQETMVEAGIPVSEPTTIITTTPLSTQFGIVNIVTDCHIKCNIDPIPNTAFKSIIKWNPSGKYIHK